MDFQKLFAVLVELLEVQAQQEEGVAQEVTYELIKKEDAQEDAAVGASVKLLIVSIQKRIMNISLGASEKKPGRFNRPGFF